MNGFRFAGMLLALCCASAQAHEMQHGHDGRNGHAAAAPAAPLQKAFGKAGDPKRATRTIRLAMSDDMRFTPSEVTVRLGETVRFVIDNKGAMLHEFVIGTPVELQEHAAMMRQFPGMEHDEPYMAHVAPGKSGEVVWNFNRPGKFSFACLIAGHFEAGMTGSITVLGAGAQGGKEDL